VIKRGIEEEEEEEGEEERKRLCQWLYLSLFQ
jgi:hypothetical protein